MTLYLDESIFNDAVIKLTKSLETNNKLKISSNEALTSFEKKITALEQRMQPVHTVTEPLTLAQDNIDMILDRMKEVLTYFDLSSSVTDNLNSETLQNNPSKYFEAVGELTKSVDYVKKHTEYKSAPSTLHALDSILTQSVEEVTKDIEAILLVPQTLLNDGPLPDITDSSKDRAKFYIKELMKAGDKKWRIVLF